MISTLLQNRYRLDAELGRGAMGLIYRGYDVLLERVVAIKVLTESGLGSAGRARLLREAQAVARLNHPNIVSLYDAGEANGTPYLVMELVDGDSLRDRPPRSPEETIVIMRQVCAALEHAHAHQVIHRDLKPENVLVVTSSPRPSFPETREGEAAAPSPLNQNAIQERGTGVEVRVKLVDFGLARSDAARVSTEGALVGTVSYIAPEQALGQPIDSRADLYALGVMLYELAAGRLPFTADDPLAVISQHLYAPLVPPSTFNPGIPPALEQLIMRLLSKRRDDRPASAQEVRQALEALRPEPVESPIGSDHPDGASLLDRIVRGRLVGRQAELTQLIELWTHAQRDAHSHLALLSGEPGVGKTRLARELLVYARLSGAVVLRGGCYEYEAATPYLPLAEALRDWVDSQPLEELRHHLSSTAFELSRLAPEIDVKLGPLAPNPPLPPSDERLRLFDHIARFLQKIAADHGLLLFIDDLHWADHGTIALLHYIMRRLRHERALVLAAYREIELDRTHPLADALVEWNRERLALRIPIGRLPPDATCAMLCGLLGLDNVTDEFAQLIQRETEGNPFFIEEVIKSLIEQGQIYRAGDHWERKKIAELAVPQSVREAIGRRLSRLNKSCLDVLHTAAALGKTFAFDELVAASTIAEEQVLDALDEAGAAQLIRSEQDAFVFTHDKIREVLYAELNPIRRRRLHQRVGESLLKLHAGTIDAHAADLAYHFAEGGDCARTMQFSLRAARQAAAVFAHDEALAYYERALECAESLNLPEQIASIEEAVGEVYYGRGPFERAVEHYQRALAQAPLNSQRAALKTKIGAVYAYVGDERGLVFLQAAERELDPQTQAGDLARALAMLGRFHHYRQEFDQSVEYLERSRQLAEPLDDPVILAEIYAYLAGAYQQAGQFERSNDWARQVLALGERRDYQYAIALGYEFLAENSFAVGHWQAALTYAARDREIGEKIGSLARVAWADISCAYAYQGLGELAAALAAIERCVALAERIGDRRLTIFARCRRATIQIDLGHDEAAQADLDFALASADEARQQQVYNWACTALFYACLQREEWDSALQVIERVTGLTGNLPVGWSVVAYFWLARRAAMAELIAANPLQINPAGPLRFQGDTWRAMGQAEALIGAPERAAAAYDHAIEIYDHLGSRLDLGRQLLYRGLLRQNQGDVESARADWLRARSIFEACGAVRDLARTERFIHSARPS
jgi:serine/threonine protein kinase/tetratricopeptide (TPR) repeat protein